MTDELDVFEQAIAELVRAAYEAELDEPDRLTADDGKEDAA